MRQLHDIDVLILMATAIASKRRPAELADIVAAADMIQGAIPFAEKLGDAIHRLSAAGLIDAAEGGYRLTTVAQELMAQQPKKADTEEAILAIKSTLATYAPTGEFPAIQPTQEELGAAIRAHVAEKKSPGKNLLMPRPKPDRHFKVEGRWRRAPAARKGKN